MGFTQDSRDKTQDNDHQRDCSSQQEHFLKNCDFCISIHFQQFHHPLVQESEATQKEKQGSRIENNTISETTT